MFDDKTNVDNVNPDEQKTDQSLMFKVGDREYDINAAKTKIEHADKHISQLEAENAQLKELASKLDKLDTLEQLLKQSAPAPQSTPEPQTQAPAPQAQINPEDLVQEVMQKLTATQQAEVQERNIESSTDKAKQVYGSEYQSKLLEIGSKLGMDQASIVNLAGSNPALFEHTFGLNKQSAPDSPASPSSIALNQAPANKPKVSDVLMANGSAKERTDFIKNALENPEAFMATYGKQA